MLPLTETQQLFSSSLSRHFASLIDRTDDSTAQRSVSLLDLGAVFASVPAALGGFGGVREMQIVSQELGYAGLTIPLLSCGMLPAIFAAHCPSSAFDLSAIATGETIMTAVPEFGTSFDSDPLNRSHV